MILGQLGIALLSSIAIIIGAELVVTNAIYFATILSFPPTILGVLIAIGTTMPEMSVAISAARKGLGKIVIGNAIGSCLANTLFILGISALINPLVASTLILYFVIPTTIVFAILLVFFMRTGYKLTRTEGVILLILYILFIIELLITQ